MLYAMTAIPLPWGTVPQTPHLRPSPKLQTWARVVSFWTSGFI